MRTLLTLVATAVLATPSLAELRLAAVFGDSMVVQADQGIEVWGWADPGGEVTVRFDDLEARAAADEDGAWRALLPPAAHTADAFAPHTVTVTSGDDELVLKDVLVGEVWLASGQSNMEMSLSRTDSVEAATKAAPYPGLRLFTVRRVSTPVEQTDVEGSWQLATAATVGDFSAAGLHFGIDLLHALDRPIGIVHSSWGGSSVEAWMSPSALLSFQGDLGGYVAWKAAEEQREGMRTLFAAESLAGADAAGWADCSLPVDFEQLAPGYDGTIWFRRKLVLPDGWAAKAETLSLGPIDDEDEVWIDGVRLGGTRNHLAPRLYPLTQAVRDVLTDGRAQIAIRVEDTGGWGGFSGAAADIALVAADGERLALTDGWSWKRGGSTPSLSPNHRPAHLYNGMLAPLIGLRLAGCIWYQGESNADDPAAYAKLFPAQIEDWRDKLGAPDLPFLWVQLANFTPGAGWDWPALREAQRNTLTRVESGGMAVTIDVGNPTDIHPRDKHTVGSRLARWALYSTYGLKVVPSGPLPLDTKREGSAVVIRFETFGAGLAMRDGAEHLGGFELRRPTGEWYQAKARLVDGGVWVEANETPLPTHVRYAWSNNPVQDSGANLVNEIGLPATPFELEL